MRKIKNIIYALIDLLTFNRGIARNINDVKVLFPAKWSRYFEADYEHENVRFMKESCRPGMTVLDIGAHLGLMSVTFSKLVGTGGKVFSFEPTPNTFKALEQIVKMNGAAAFVTPVNAAVSNVVGEMNFYLASEEGNNANSLLSRNHRDRTPVRIRVTTIDEFVAGNGIKKIDFMKIDAEGSEFDVLRGGLDTLKRFHPKVILAIHPPLIENNGQKPEMIYGLLKDLGYNIVCENRTLSEKEFCERRDFFDVHLTHHS